MTLIRWLYRPLRRLDGSVCARMGGKGRDAGNASAVPPPRPSPNDASRSFHTSSRLCAGATRSLSPTPSSSTPSSPPSSTLSSLSRPPTLPNSFSPLGRAVLASAASLGALINPRRADLVAVVGETTGTSALMAMRDAMRRHPEGLAVLAERPRITDASTLPLRDLSPGTFGHAYAQFMDQRHFHADDRPAVRLELVEHDEELAYVATRAREVHDLWHTLTGCPTTVLGELTLKALEFVQTGMPVAALSVLGAQMRLSTEERGHLWSGSVPWAVRTGLRCEHLMSVYYERYWEMGLEEIRGKLRLTRAPLFVRGRV